MMASKSRASASNTNPNPCPNPNTSVDVVNLEPTQSAATVGAAAGELGVGGSVAAAELDVDVGRVAAGEPPPTPFVVHDGDCAPALASSSSAKYSLRADCWKHMVKKKVIDDGVVHFFVVCNYCKSELSAGLAAGIGHLNRHYKACLAKLGKIQGGGTQTNLNFCADGTISIWVYNPQVACDEIAKFIVCEDLLIMLGESQNFKNLFQHAFCPQYQSVIRKTTKSDSIAIYKNKLVALKESFKKVYFSFALTSDIWTSSHQKTCYVSVVAHYLDDSYALNKQVIGFRMMDESQTGDAIANHILEVVRDFEIDSKILSITLDNASANTTIIDILTPSVVVIYKRLYYPS
jgi:hypothetical protein